MHPAKLTFQAPRAREQSPRPFRDPSETLPRRSRDTLDASSRRLPRPGSHTLPLLPARRCACTSTTSSESAPAASRLRAPSSRPAAGSASSPGSTLSARWWSNFSGGLEAAQPAHHAAAESQHRDLPLPHRAKQAVKPRIIMQDPQSSVLWALVFRSGKRRTPPIEV